MRRLAIEGLRFEICKSNASVLSCLNLEARLSNLAHNLLELLAGAAVVVQLGVIYVVRRIFCVSMHCFSGLREGLKRLHLHLLS